MMRVVCVLVFVVCAAHCAMDLRSPAFHMFGAIPEKYGCDYIERDYYRPSPPLYWERIPAKTQSFVLMVDDMDNDGFIHWLVTDIPGNVTEIAEDASEYEMPGMAKEWPNAWGHASYGGPCPEDETHRYRFRLFARSWNFTNLVPSTHAADIEAQLADSIYTAVLVGTYYIPAYHPPVDPPKRLNKTLINPPPPLILPLKRFVKPSEVIDATRGKVSHETLSPKCTGANRAQTCKVPPKPQLDTEVMPEKARAPCVDCSGEVEVHIASSPKDPYDCRDYGKGPGCHMTMHMPLLRCDDHVFPTQFLCNYTDRRRIPPSPPLNWYDPGNHTMSYVFLVWDASNPPATQDMGKVYWLVTDIPFGTTSLHLGASLFNMPLGSIEQRNSFGAAHYSAPCPPSTEFRTLRFQLFTRQSATTPLILPNIYENLRANDVLSQLEDSPCIATVDYNVGSEGEVDADIGL